MNLKLLAWLPIEPIIHDRQGEYYAAINAANNAAGSTPFIEFMLSAIKSSFIKIIQTSDEMIEKTASKEQRRWLSVQSYLCSHDVLQNAACALLNVSPATANRLLRTWTEEGKLEKIRSGKICAYRIKE